MFTAQALQIALVHLCFNVIGIVLFYPLPFMRWPIHMARTLGDITSRYRLVKGIAS
jgi:sodium-dependent phosphate cotransporter